MILADLDPRVRILVEQVATRLDMNRVLNHRIPLAEAYQTECCRARVLMQVIKVMAEEDAKAQGLRLKLAGRSIEMAAH
ncbi:hypothetical protein [Candidatus Binatus sp.]|uniref:hypothetical protein n=1 Tax=Candidatus Binatus sp. TaxID=2811406 RepID=UPI002FD91039